MAADTWTALTSLAGVTLGGGLSFLVQRSTQRTVARTEQRKLEVTRADARRAERLALLERFIGAAAEAERQAFGRPPDPFDPEGAWAVAAQAVMDRLWVAERMVRVLFPLPVHDAARVYFLVLNGAVWQGVPAGESARDLLEGPRLAFLDEARAALEGPAA
ncbi:hypothetical protein Ani05nite_23330 [Amorphoplanes nipponensis]|uniref:Uncharacterized protein n=1 Tax=Actinoplanes nipponensis TaxID=135950 RepID=A0A919MGP0_9ACTN|nr:hypothetical protein [Actinoplanes nipponensis]GIE48799.1 hypothetical protein Ani05nite_23330 [Actinoplanes nipponensis]